MALYGWAIDESPVLRLNLFIVSVDAVI